MASHLDGRFQGAHLRHLHLKLFVEAADPATDALAQLPQRRFHLELGLIPLKLHLGVRIDLGCNAGDKREFGIRWAACAEAAVNGKR